MTTALFWHEAALDHVTPPGHPERVARVEAIQAELQDLDLDRRVAPLADIAEVYRCHPEAYAARVQAAIPATGYVSLDADTHVSSGSLQAALRAVGGCNAAVDAVISGEVANAFVSQRPPGHHAETETAMGFCLFGTVAIAAKHALDHHGLARVAVLDFDVHHGNGTQDLLWNEARAMFASSHQMPLYPGSGASHETGAHGQIVNVPLTPMSGGEAMRRAWGNMILPAVRDFEPELILISAGFDAHEDDPLANLRWSAEDFAWLTHAICDVADEVAKGRVVSTLEGGYDLDGLSASVRRHVEVLMERGNG